MALTFAPDTSCMVAAICSWHEHHAAAASEINRRLDRGEHLAVAAPALVEAYAVLTRLPSPHRLTHDDAWALIKANFVDRAAVATLNRDGYVGLLQRLPRLGIGGGRTYDAVIADCARHGKADALLTFNRRHFDPPPEGVTIVEPSRRG